MLTSRLHPPEDNANIHSHQTRNIFLIRLSSATYFSKAYEYSVQSVHLTVTPHVVSSELESDSSLGYAGPVMSKKPHSALDACGSLSASPDFPDPSTLTLPTYVLHGVVSNQYNDE